MTSGWLIFLIVGFFSNSCYEFKSIGTSEVNNKKIHLEQLIERLMELKQNQLPIDTYLIDSEESEMSEHNDNDLLPNKRAFEALGKRNMGNLDESSYDSNEKNSFKRAFEALGRRSIYNHPSKELKNIDLSYQRLNQKVNEQKRGFEALGRK